MIANLFILEYAYLVCYCLYVVQYCNTLLLASCYFVSPNWAFSINATLTNKKINSFLIKLIWFGSNKKIAETQPNPNRDLLIGLGNGLSQTQFDPTQPIHTLQTFRFGLLGFGSRLDQCIILLYEDLCILTKKDLCIILWTKCNNWPSRWLMSYSLLTDKFKIQIRVTFRLFRLRHSLPAYWSKIACLCVLFVFCMGPKDVADVLSPWHLDILKV